MAGATKWREEKAEERREERETQTPQRGHTPRSRSGHSTSQSTPAAAPATPPDGWTQEEWDHVPQSMKGRVGSDGGYVSKEAVRRYMNNKDP